MSTLQINNAYKQLANIKNYRVYDIKEVEESLEFNYSNIYLLNTIAK